MIAYKVCKIIDTLIPPTCVSIMAPRQYWLFYELNKKTVAELGMIFVFKSFAEAQWFGRLSCENYIILMGEAEDICDSDILIIPYSNYFWRYKEFWDTFVSDDRSTHNMCIIIVGEYHNVPKDTVLCKAFTPLEIEYDRD